MPLSTRPTTLLLLSPPPPPTPRHTSLFPNWVVKHIRNPNLSTKEWLKRPVEVFHVSPKMGKLDIMEYLRVLYNLPVTKVHTANYLGKWRRLPTGGQRKEPDYKKAWVYLKDEIGTQRPRYTPIEAQLQPAAMASWPALPGEGASELRAKLLEERKGRNSPWSGGSQGGGRGVGGGS